MSKKGCTFPMTPPRSIRGIYRPPFRIIDGLLAIRAGNQFARGDDACPSLLGDLVERKGATYFCCIHMCERTHRVLAIQLEGGRNFLWITRISHGIKVCRYACIGLS